MSAVDETEIWKPVVGFQGYEVSSLGRVRSLTRYVKGKVSPRINHGRVMKLASVGRYLAVSLSTESEKVTRSVHVLVAEAFIGPRPPGYHVCHNDGDSLNNRLSNLRYDTPANNCADMEQHGRRCRGERVPWSRLTETEVREMRRLHRSGFGVRELSDTFNVACGTARKAIKGLSWRHV
jgi:hypothetical protein